MSSLVLTSEGIGSGFLPEVYIVARPETLNRCNVADITIRRHTGEFDDWAALHRLLHQAFAGMEDRIDPPSSLHRMTPETLREKARAESLRLAFSGKNLVGCGFGAVTDDLLYLSKLAVAPAHQRRGILRKVIAQFEEDARQLGLVGLYLQTRIELIENHATFQALGFEKSAETAHPGFDRPTSFTFRKML